MDPTKRGRGSIEQPQSIPAKTTNLVNAFNSMLKKRAKGEYVRLRTFFLSKIPYLKTVTGAKADQQLIKQINEQPPRDLKEMLDLMQKHSTNNGKRGVFNKQLKEIQNQIPFDLREHPEIYELLGDLGDLGEFGEFGEFGELDITSIGDTIEQFTEPKVSLVNDHRRGRKDDKHTEDDSGKAT